MRATILMLAMVTMALIAPAHAAFDVVSRAYEVSPRNFTMPTTPNGGLIMRECSACDARMLRVTSTTIYSFDGRQMSLDRFREALMTAPADAVTIGVTHHLESDTVLRVSATLSVEP